LVEVNDVIYVSETNQPKYYHLNTKYSAGNYEYLTPFSNIHVAIFVKIYWTKCFLAIYVM